MVSPVLFCNHCLTASVDVNDVAMRYGIEEERAHYSAVRRCTLCTTCALSQLQAFTTTPYIGYNHAPQKALQPHKLFVLSADRKECTCMP